MENELMAHVVINRDAWKLNAEAEGRIEIAQYEFNEAFKDMIPYLEQDTFEQAVEMAETKRKAWETVLAAGKLGVELKGDDTDTVEAAVLMIVKIQDAYRELGLKIP